MLTFITGKLGGTVNGCANHRCTLPVRISHIIGSSVQKDMLGPSFVIFCFSASETCSYTAIEVSYCAHETEC